MAYLVFNARNKKQGDIEVVSECASYTANYQVIGDGEVEFSGSNVPPDLLNPDDDAHWIPILTLKADVPDTEPFRQHTWNSLRYKVVSGERVGVFVAVGVGS